MASYNHIKYKLLEIKHIIKEIIIVNKIAVRSKKKDKPKTDRPICIAMIDGTAMHGGMCDRFKGIVSLYAYCKFHKIPFRIKYTYPFNIEDYLSPSDYDWRLKEDEYTDNPKYCRALYMRKEFLGRRLLRLKTKKQVHFYGNRNLLPYINDAYAENENVFTWGELFRELFKPGLVLEQRLKSVKKNLGNEYYAAVFRFQNLLGDFKEYHFKSINDKDEAENLIKKCLNSILDLRTAHPDKALLVTSDSITFLKRASAIDGVHIIPGTLIHMDGQKDLLENPYEIYLKSFLDFYALSEAQKIYRIGTSFMYPSEFPMYAAKVHNIPFQSVII